jgi:hypothetical protein
VHAELQHKPSTQWLVAHCVDASQGVPWSSFGMQTPAEQNCDAEQSAFTAQPFAQMGFPAAHPFDEQS